MKSTITVATLLTLITITSGCTIGSQAPLEVVQTPRQRPELILPPVTQINTLPVDWVIITEGNIQEIFQQLRSEGNQPVLFALTTENYENLGINQAEFLRLIREQRAVIVAYRNYYEETPTNQ